MKIADLRKQRALACDALAPFAEKKTLTVEEQTDYDAKKRAVEEFDGQIKRALEIEALAAEGAKPVDGQERALPARAEDDPYASDAAAERRGLGKSRSLVLGGVVKMIGRARGSLRDARADSIELYGENHPVTRALVTSVGVSGGFIVPPDYMNDIIEMLRARAQVRGAGPRVIPMPRGTMTLPGQASSASASYGSETKAIASSQPGMNQIVASFKKLTALVPVSNDMMRYADPAIDAFVRDDLVKVVGLREDLAFLLGDGTQDTPRGFTSFANGFAAANGGTAGSWNPAANSVAAVGGNFITSTANYTLATASAELGGLVNKLDSANVPAMKRVWFMHPRTYNFLYNVQNSLGLYVFRNEMDKGTLLKYPVRTTTQFPANIWDATGTNKDCSFIILAEMDETMILDSMSMALDVSREGTYIDGSGATISAFQNDQTLIRAIAEHDFQLRHDASVAVAQFVRWAPAIQ